MKTKIQETLNEINTRIKTGTTPFKKSNAIKIGDKHI